MKWKNRSFILLISIVFFLFLGNAKAMGPYEVSVVNSNGSEQSIGKYSDYNQAKKVMLEHSSDSQHVAVIKEGGEIINAKYAIVRFLYDTAHPFAENPNNEHRLFQNATDSAAYTTIHAAYGNDAAFLDYEPNVGGKGRAKVKVSGYTGWINRGYYTVVPVSRLYGGEIWVSSQDSTWFQEIGNSRIQQNSNTNITIRTGPGTQYSAIGYSSKGSIYTYIDVKKTGGLTWYKISTIPLKTYYKVSDGELRHYFATASTQGVTNLGKAPSFLASNRMYYSFDGNYYYEDLNTMLSDYRNNTYDHSINARGPYYPYYLYLSNHSRTSYTANDFNQIVINKGFKSPSDSKMYGEGANFILSQERFGVNALLTFSAAVNESATGSSAIAMQKNNLFGHNAYGNNPLANATYYNTVADSIMMHASMTGAGFNNPTDNRYYGGHYGNKSSGMNVKYATDPYWGEKMASNAYAADKDFGLQEWQGSTIGIKASFDNVPIKKQPSDQAETIYLLKNANYSVKNIPVIVTDKIYQNGKYWYKVYSDASLDDQQNITTAEYRFDKSYGYIEEKDLYVTNAQPTIIANDRVIHKGENIDLLLGVLANDPENGDITSSITISGEVYINIPGEYKITYTAEDHQHFKVSKTITVTVMGDSIPEINAQDQSISQYTSFDPKKNVSAKDAIDGDISNHIQIVENTVDINKIGSYKITYKVTNSTGKSVTKTINVQVIENEKPVIYAEDVKIAKNSTFNPLDYVTATDKEDGTIEKIEVIENSVDTTQLGKYLVTYKVVDSANQEISKTINVEVVEKVKQQKKASYYLDYIKQIGEKLEIKGYHAILGIDNVLSTKIYYRIQFVDINTNQVLHEQIATRITDPKDMTMPVFSEDGKDYTYSWFKFQFDLKKVPEGNYKMYIISETDNYYAISTVSNKLFAPQATSFSGEKHVIIRNNYSSNEAPIELLIRNEKIADRTTATYSYNQFDQYLDLHFTENGQLYLKGTSYSYGSNLASNTNVIRKIIFENQKNYKKYQYDIGSITTGPYAVALPVSDHLDKTRAWYEKQIDLNDLEVGKYTIYIANASNISDVAEFKDLLNRQLHLSKKIGTKIYTFMLNSQNNNIELIVEK